jgi:hypothetical protein
MNLVNLVNLMNLMNYRVTDRAILRRFTAAGL